MLVTDLGSYIVLKGCPESVKEIGYFSQVRPLLEYCSPVWSPHQVGLVHDFESTLR